MIAATEQPAGKAARIGPGDVLAVVCRVRLVSEGAVLSDCRDEPTARARHMVFWFLRHGLNWTHEQVGRYVGGKDHGTVMHGCKRVSDYMQQDDQFLLDFAEVKRELASLFRRDRESVRKLRENITQLLELT